MSSAGTVRTKALVASRSTAVNRTIARAERIQPPEVVRRGESLPYQPTEEGLFPRLAVDFGERFGKRNFFRASLHAILCVGAILDAAMTHRGLHALSGVHPTGGMHVEEAHLAENGGAHEFAVFVHLRANFQAISAGDAARKRISPLLCFGSHAR